MEETNVPIFAQAKIEYTNQLVDILYPHMKVDVFHLLNA